MPIKGLTENRRMTRLGKIHLGIKKKNGKGVEYPSAVDYFVCPPEVTEVLGEKPKELRVLIPTEDTEKWASQYYRCYSMTRGLICKGDGETARRSVDTKTGALANRDTKESVYKDIPCQGKQCPDYGRQCKEVMNLQFLLPDVPGLGVWQIDTSSINSILNINAAAELIRGVLGRVAMVPLLLTIEPQKVTSPVDGKLKTVHVLNLRVKETLIEMMKVAQLPPSQVLLPAPDESELPTSDDETPGLIMPQNQGASKEKADKDIKELWSEKEAPSTEQPTSSVTKDQLATLKGIKESGSNLTKLIKGFGFGVTKVSDLTEAQAQTIIDAETDIPF